MNSPIPGGFYLFLSSSILSEAPSFPRSFPRLWALAPARLSLDSAIVSPSVLPGALPLRRFVDRT